MHQILIIDDEEAVTFGYERYLTRRGFAVHTASTLLEAQQRLSTNSYRAVVMDLRLPDGNGLEFIPKLRQQYQGMTIIVASGLDDEATVKEALSGGANCCLRKPVQMQTICASLLKALQSGVDHPV